MTITIKLNTGNAAFCDSDAGETDRDAQQYARDIEASRILRSWALRIPEDGYGANLRDSNGNTVGSVTVRGK